MHQHSTKNAPLDAPPSSCFYTAPSGNFYHADDCCPRLTRSSPKPITGIEAAIRGLRPCNRCRTPMPSLGEREGRPVVLATPDPRGGSVLIVCPYCTRHHTHGHDPTNKREPNTRAAHCGACDEYYIVWPEQVKRWVKGGVR